MQGLIGVFLFIQATIMLFSGLFLGVDLGYYGQATVLFIGAVLAFMSLIIMIMEET